MDLEEFCSETLIRYFGNWWLLSYNFICVYLKHSAICFQTLKLVRSSLWYKNYCFSKHNTANIALLLIAVLF